MYEKYHSREEFMRKVRKNYLTIPLSDEEIKRFGLVEYEPYNIADDDIERILGKWELLVTEKRMTQWSSLAIIVYNTKIAKVAYFIKGFVF